MVYSAQAWESVRHVTDAILEHPFNQELALGTLSQDKFAYYIEQDSRYLHDFAICHAIIASKIQSEYIRIFLRYADTTIIDEHEVVHQYFKQIYQFESTGKITPATLSYTSYLLRICSTEPVEVAVAVILPCFWVYREVGLAISKNSAPDNPFARWIETYASADFSATVDEAISIFETLAAKTTPEIRQRMLEAFYNSTVLEWHFWNDAYHKKVFDQIGVMSVV
jgi:thiaminase/transcriptional activator TenA